MTARPATPEDWRSAVEWLVSAGLTGKRQVIRMGEAYDTTLDAQLMDPDDVPAPRDIKARSSVEYPHLVEHVVALDTGATLYVYALARKGWVAGQVVAA